MTDLTQSITVNTAQACRLLNISESSLKRIILAGQLPKVRLGPRRIAFRVSDLHALVDAGMFGQR